MTDTLVQVLVQTITALVLIFIVCGTISLALGEIGRAVRAVARRRK